MVFRTSVQPSFGGRERRLNLALVRRASTGLGVGFSNAFLTRDLRHSLFFNIELLGFEIPQNKSLKL